MKPEEWTTKVTNEIADATGVEITPEDVKTLYQLLSSVNSPLRKALIYSTLRTMPTSTAILRMDLASPEGIQKAQRTQGKMIGTVEFIESLVALAAGALGDTENAA